MQGTDVVTFGETMLRLSPPAHDRLEGANTLDAYIGGSESNTAVALALLGRRVTWWSRLPDNPLGRKVDRAVRGYGVDTSRVVWRSSGRVGVYYVEVGAEPRAYTVLYDRAGSEASTICAADVTRDRICCARHLHLTGITPALSETCNEAVVAAASLAVSAGMTYSVDINYRSKLWPVCEARPCIEMLLAEASLVLCTLEDAGALFGFTGTASAIARHVKTRANRADIVVTCGQDGALVCTGDQEHSVGVYRTDELDRVGSGDAFCAGVLDGWLAGDILRGARMGAAMAAVKRTVRGDMLLASRSEIESLIAGAGVGIQR